VHPSKPHLRDAKSAYPWGRCFAHTLTPVEFGDANVGARSHPSCWHVLDERMTSPSFLCILQRTRVPPSEDNDGGWPYVAGLWHSEHLPLRGIVDGKSDAQPTHTLLCHLPFSVTSPARRGTPRVALSLLQICVSILFFRTLGAGLAVQVDLTGRKPKLKVEGYGIWNMAQRMKDEEIACCVLRVACDLAYHCCGPLPPPHSKPVAPRNPTVKRKRFRCCALATKVRPREVLAYTQKWQGWTIGYQLWWMQMERR